MLILCNHGNNQEITLDCWKAVLLFSFVQLGFFKLKKSTEIKKKMRELEEDDIEEEGITSGIGGGSTEYIIAS